MRPLICPIAVAAERSRAFLAWVVLLFVFAGTPTSAVIAQDASWKRTAPEDVTRLPAGLRPGTALGDRYAIQMVTRAYDQQGNFSEAVRSARRGIEIGCGWCEHYYAKA